MSKRIGKVIKTAPILFTLLLSGCDRPPDVVSITMPVIEECKDYAKNFLKLHPGSKIESYYRDFDVRLDSHPSIVGILTIVAELQSSEKAPISDRDRALANANRIMADCYPEANVKPKRDARAFDFIEYKIKENEEAGIDKNYIVIDKDTISLYYHDKSREKME